MDKTEQLKNASVAGLIVRMSTPAIVSLLCNSINMAIDRMFIAKGVGTLALSAVTVAFGLYLVMQACSQLVGTGAAAVTALELGKGEQARAEKTVGQALLLSVLLAVVVSLVGVVCLQPLLMLYGADAENLAYARDYASVMMAGALCFVLAQSMNSIVRGMGYAKRSLVNFLSSIVINLLLDAVFIFVFGWGVRGAALATVIGNGICALLAIGFLCSRQSDVPLRWRGLKPDGKMMASIVAIGISGFIAQFALSIVTLVFNHACRSYGGNTAVAAYGIISTLFMLVYMPMIGLGQGLQPIVGVNYGAQRWGRVRQALLKAFQYATIFCVALFLLFECLAPQIVAAFGGAEDVALSAVAVSGMRIYGLMTPFVGMQMVDASFFQYIGQVKQSMFLSALRQMLLLIPLLLVLPLCFGMRGVWAATPLADGLSFVVTMWFVRRELAVLRKNEC